MTTSEPAPTIGDTKDWTWTTVRACPDCGADPHAVTAETLGKVLRSTTSRWLSILGRDDVRQRPEPNIWSPLEYACHVRDVHRLFVQRVTLMLAQSNPHFPDWDQDAAAIDGCYWEANPAKVAVELTGAAEVAASSYDDVPSDSWPRRSVRGDGGAFTVSSMGRYHLHDVLHHLYDVRG